MIDVFAPYERAPQDEALARREAKRQEQRLRAAVDALMDGPDGRCLLRWLLQLCQCFQALAPTENAHLDTHRLIFAEGRRFVGMRLLRLMQDADAGHLPRLLQTKEDDHGI
ncbi:hypothetical protein [uncultured Desulfovibrio sp.]|uniref:Bbp19 family protein n=1 Tax=uncultured Desulfovibrio sp. TaxID=167968 RepID=UPI00260D062D|nr:hypothetical protein [uncultured Desulfovibrio sp.]